MDMTLIEAITKLREEGKSDEAIARMSDVNTTTVWRARRTESARYSHAMKIIRAAERYFAEKKKAARMEKLA